MMEALKKTSGETFLDNRSSARTSFGLRFERGGRAG
jgi:hypothetical protein